MLALAGPSASDLDDLVQLAAEQVFRSMHTFAGQSELTTWIYSICYRVLLRERRWYKRFRLRFELVDDAELDIASDEPAPGGALERREQLSLLHAGLRQMSDKYRAVVVLHDIEELPIRDIAHIVGAGELTVRSRLRDGRKQLQRLLHQTSARAPFGGEHELEPT